MVVLSDKERHSGLVGGGSAALWVYESPSSTSFALDDGNTSPRASMYYEQAYFVLVQSGTCHSHYPPVLVVLYSILHQNK